MSVVSQTLSLKGQSHEKVDEITPWGSNQEQLLIFLIVPLIPVDFLSFIFVQLNWFSFCLHVLSTGFQFGILSGAQCAHSHISGILCANFRMLDWYPVCQCKIQPHRTESSVCDCFPPQDTNRNLSLAHRTPLISCVPTT
jgi:hypothetical protein